MVHVHSPPDRISQLLHGISKGEYLYAVNKEHLSYSNCILTTGIPDNAGWICPFVHSLFVARLYCELSLFSFFFPLLNLLDQSLYECTIGHGALGGYTVSMYSVEYLISLR